MTFKSILLGASLVLTATVNANFSSLQPYSHYLPPKHILPDDVMGELDVAYSRCRDSLPDDMKIIFDNVMSQIMRAYTYSRMGLEQESLSVFKEIDSYLDQVL